MERRTCQSCNKEQMWDELYGFANQLCPEFCTFKFTEILPMRIEDCWINLDEAVPEAGKHVLTFELGAPPMPIKVNYIRSDYKLEFAYGDTSKITHWMPLPDHPVE